MSLPGETQPRRWRVEPRSAQDTPELIELWVAAWRATYPDIDFAARRDWLAGRLASLESRGALTLCLREDAPAALAGFVVIDPSTGWLDQLCVRPERFGAGAGATLLGAARRAAPQGVRLDVNADNFRALRFYEREGFARIGEGPRSQSGRATLVLEWRPGAQGVV